MPSRLPRSVFGSTRDWLRRRRKLALLLLAAGVGVRAFWKLAEELGQGELLPLDLAVQELVRPYHTPLLDALARALSTLPTLPWVLLLVVPFFVYLLGTRRYRAAGWLSVTPPATVVLVEMLKLIFRRDRPLTAVVAEIGPSFPSGHATGATVLYGCLAYIAWRYWVRRPWPRIVVLAVAGVLIAGTGLARVYPEVHYPSDVLAGWSAGLCILAAAIPIGGRGFSEPPVPSPPGMTGEDVVPWACVDSRLPE